MPYLFWETFGRLEMYLKDCPTYERGVLGYATVLASYNAYHCYVFLGINTVYHRSPFHVIAWFGIFLTELAVAGLDAIWMNVETSRVACNPHMWNEPSPAIAIVTYVTVYYLLYDLANEPGPLLMDFACLVWHVIFLLTTVLAELHLQLHNIREVVMGAAVGALVGALVVTVITFAIVPYFGSRFFRYFRKVTFMDGEKFRS
jgi:hypothetical protein